MKAIVLTYDKYISLTDHMLYTYQKLWPSNKFQFVVPYQKYPDFLKEKYGSKIELVKTEQAIKPTIQTLLAPIDDNEWIYWCIDDKYLIRINEKKANRIYEWVTTIKDVSVAGIMFSRCRSLLNKNNLRMGNTIISDDHQVFMERKTLRHIWLHQFLRARVIKDLFAGFPDTLFAAKEMDSWVMDAPIPEGRKLYVAEKNIVVFGESTHRGNLTRNCVKSFKKHGLKLPDHFKISDKFITVGRFPFWNFWSY